MKAIIEKLMDPSFMIPALCVAVVSGVVVSYIRSGVAHLISYLAGKNKQKKAEHQAKQEAEASMIASDPILLNRALVNVSGVHTELIVLMVALIIIFSMAFALPVRSALGRTLLLVFVGFISGGLSGYYRDHRNRMAITQRAMDIFFNKNN